MLISSVRLIGLFLAYLIAVSAYNQSGIMVLALTSAIHCTIYEALRSIAVWIASVALDFVWPESGAGEKLNWMSFVRGGGFLVMLVGSMIYNRLIRIPGFDDHEAAEKKEDREEVMKEGMDSSASMPSLKEESA
jgi:hypothetical protein